MTAKDLKAVAAAVALLAVPQAALSQTSTPTVEGAQQFLAEVLVGQSFSTTTKENTLAAPGVILEVRNRGHCDMTITYSLPSFTQKGVDYQASTLTWPDGRLTHLSEVRNVEGSNVVSISWSDKPPPAREITLANPQMAKRVANAFEFLRVNCDVVNGHGF